MINPVQSEASVGPPLPLEAPPRLKSFREILDEKAFVNEKPEVKLQLCNAYRQMYGLAFSSIDCLDYRAFGWPDEPVLELIEGNAFKHAAQARLLDLTGNALSERALNALAGEIDEGWMPRLQAVYTAGNPVVQTPQLVEVCRSRDIKLCWDKIERTEGLRSGSTVATEATAAAADGRRPPSLAIPAPGDDIFQQSLNSARALFQAQAAGFGGGGAEDLAAQLEAEATAAASSATDAIATAADATTDAGTSVAATADTSEVSYYMVDCGSHATSLLRMHSDESGKLSGWRHKIMDKERALVAPDARQIGISLDRDVLSRDEPHDLSMAIGIFVRLLTAELQRCGDDGDTAIFLGCTAGCRGRLDRPEGSDGVLSRAPFAELAAALVEALGARVHLKVLGGEEEAIYEYHAMCAVVGHLTTPLLGKGQVVGIFSGGGRSCQFVRLQGEEEELHRSIEMAADSAMAQQLRESGRAAVGPIEEQFRATLAEANLPRLTGSWFGLEAHADFAELGFADQIVQVHELRRIIEQILEDMFAQSGARWAAAHTKWGQRASHNWAIGAVCGLRLLTLLSCFDDSAELFFPVESTQLPLTWATGRCAMHAHASPADRAKIDEDYPAFHGIDFH